MIGLSFLQVLLRQFLGTGLLWADTLSRHLVLWVGFLGAALAAAEGKHFAWEAVTHREGSTGAVLRLASSLAAIAITAILALASWDFFVAERAQGSALFTAGALTVPSWPFSAIIPIGFGLVLFHMALRGLAAAWDIRQ